MHVRTRSRPSTVVLRGLNLAACLGAMTFVLWKNGAGAQDGPTGTLRLRIVDGSGAATPARVEVLDRQGKGHVAADALLIADTPIKRDTPWSGTPDDALKLMTREFKHTFSRSLQFYSGGS